MSNCCEGWRRWSGSFLVSYTFSRWEIRSVIRFLTSCNEYAVSIYRQLVETYDGEVMSRGHVPKWVRMVRLFKGSPTDTQDEKWSEIPCVISEELVQQIEEKNFYNRHVALNTLKESFPRFSQILLDEIVTKRLGYKKLSAGWVQKKKKKLKTKRGKVDLGCVASWWQCQTPYHLGTYYLGPAHVICIGYKLLTHSTFWTWHHCISIFSVNYKSL